MENHIKTWVQLAATLATGLSAGLFYAWAVSVIPGTRRISDAAYLETMQQINRAILNPAFFMSFMGAAILLVIHSVLEIRTGFNAATWLVMGAAAAYIIGTFGVTIFGNVPLNEMLDAIQLSALNDREIARTRADYEGDWNRLNTVRTLFALLSFSLLLAALSFTGSAQEATSTISTLSN